MNDNHYETATFANGCFWCTEAVFKRVKGVISVQSGFSGGKRPHPTYMQVASGATGHAESLQITFDPTIISFEKLLDIFWATHDPTSLNQQGNDVGTEYRSAIFYHDEKQKEIAEKSKAALEKSGVYKDPTLPTGRQVVTEITPFTNFYPADDYHKDFYESGKRPDYCRYIIYPKIRKLMTNFSNDVKEEYLDKG